MSHWKWRPINEVCDTIVDCVNRTAPVVQESTPYKMIRTTNIRNGRIDLDDTRRVTRATYEKWTRRLVPQRGDVFLTREAPLGEAAMLRSDEPVFLGQRIMHYRTDPRLMDRGFLSYALQSHRVQAEIQAYGSGSTVAHMRVGDAKEFRVPVPALQVQRRIADSLSAYDDLIENNNRRMALLEESIHLLYREWFVYLRFPGHERVKVVDGVPEGWSRSALETLCTVVRGRSYRTADLKNPKARPFITLKNVDRGGSFRLAGLKTYSGKFKPQQVCKPGDILIAVTDMSQKREIVARAARVPDLPRLHDAVFSMDLAKVAPLAPDEAEFLYWLLRASGFSDEVKNHANGTNVLHLKPARITDYELVLPPPKLRRLFGQEAEPIQTLMDQLSRTNLRLREARDLLLPRLMDGRIPV